MKSSLRKIMDELGAIYRRASLADIERTTEAAVSKGETYGLTSCGAVLCLASLILEFGPEFDRESSDPAFARALSDRSGSEAYRIDELMRHALRRCRDEDDDRDTLPWGEVA